MDEKEQNNNDSFEQLLDNDADQPVEGTTAEAVEEKPAEEVIETVKTEVVTESKTPSGKTVTEVVETEVVTEPKAPKKKHTGLIVGLILFFLIAICGGAFAAFAIIKNQPENIVAESFVNFINAKQVAVSGSFSITPKSEYSSAIGPINVTLSSQAADINQSGDVNVSVNLPAYGKNIELRLSEAVMKDGVIYVKASGITKLYNDFLSELVQEQLGKIIYSNVTNKLTTACGDYSGEEFLNCLNSINDATSNPAVSQAIEDLVVKVDSVFEKLVKKVDDQWVKISIKDILENELVSSYINSTTKESITKAYDCSVDLANNLNQDSNEYGELYSQNKFLGIEPADNSFYKLSLDASSFTNYLKALPNTKPIKDYLSCGGVSNSDNLSLNVSASNIEETIKNLPAVYARFDGFLNHNLAELKMNHDTDYYSIAFDLNFSYPGGLTVGAPADSIPVMTLIQDIYEEIMDVYQTMASA